MSEMKADELPGELALARAVKEGKWPHTMDAQEWAREFAKTFGRFVPDDGTLIGWFSNAIMAGYDTAMLRRATPPRAAAWRPIAEAPRDGTEILIWRDGWDFAPLAKWGENDGEDGVFYGWVLRDGVYPGCGVEDGFIGWQEDIDDGQMPTLWLPAPPDSAGQPQPTVAQGRGTLTKGSEGSGSA